MKKRIPDLAVLIAELRVTGARIDVEDAKSVAGSSKARAAAQRDMEALEAKEKRQAAEIFAYPVGSLSDIEELIWFMEARCPESLNGDLYLRGAFDALRRGVDKLADNESRKR